MRTALVVDDSLMMREVFSTYLHNAGFSSITKVSSVEEAQQTLNSDRPDLIILDVVMGGKSGFEFCHQLKKSRQTCSIPVIICSTKTTQADFFLGDIIGADAYLPKTVNQAEFISTAQQLSRKPAVCKLIR
ncbi:response regulator [Pleurocapsales cyanobacterium LEGE 10410]|nr:response regulator [Pleurocapsales cyanobacterium LEGE 10410]